MKHADPPMDEPQLRTASLGWMTAPRAGGLLSAALWLALAAGAAILTHHTLSETARLMLFLLAVLVSAVRYGFWVGVISAAASVLLFNFIFVEPHFSFDIARPESLVTLLVFMLVAGLIGLLAGRLRGQRDDAEERATLLATISEVSRDIASAPTPEAVLNAALTHMTSLTRSPGMVLKDDGHGAQLLLSRPEDRVPGADDLQAAQQALRRGGVEFATAPGWDGSRFTFFPIRAEGAGNYVIGHERIGAPQMDLDYREQAITVIVRQSELALQRLAFAASANDERRKAETESLKATLLSSLSHDLRTPLATILGSVTTLRELGPSLPAPARSDLLMAIEEEAQRLNRYVANLLHMTRLQSGLGAQMSWLDAGDVARAAMLRATRAFPQARIQGDLPEMPMIRGEAALLEQALFNLMENAAKYAPGPITLSGRREGGELVFAVSDTGPGLPENVRMWLNSDRLAAGPELSGLGLPICKGIVRALGGRLSAQTQQPHGAQIALHLPVPSDAMPRG